MRPYIRGYQNIIDACNCEKDHHFEQEKVTLFGSYRTPFSGPIFTTNQSVRSSATVHPCLQ